MNSLYGNAVKAIRSHAEATQSRLDVKAHEARVAYVAALRAAAVSGIDQDSPAYAVCLLVSQTIVVGREDGYPAVRLPEDTKRVVRAARNAGLIPMDGRNIIVGALKFYEDLSGISRLPESNEDYSAWSKANSYRRAQELETL